jgi:hypothetical protein
MLLRVVSRGLTSVRLSVFFKSTVGIRTTDWEHGICVPRISYRSVRATGVLSNTYFE